MIANPISTIASALAIIYNWKKRWHKSKHAEMGMALINVRAIQITQ